MLGLGRNGLRKLAGRRALSSAAAQTSASTPTPPPQSSESRKPFTRSNNKQFVVSTPVEQIRLQKKYQEKLEQNKLESLHEAVEYIEWRGTVFPQTVTKIISLLERSADLQSLSDRQLGVLLSVFGAACDTVSRSIRAQHLERVESILREKGVVLGHFARNQLIEAKIDNRSRVDAVEELQKFEEVGIELDAKSYALLCEVYAKQANTKAITDIIAHMKTSGIPLTEDHVAQLVYSVARGGNYGHVGRVVDTFATSMNVVRLRCAAARAIAEREKSEPGRGGFEVTEMLRAIPTTARIHTFDNNVYVTNVLMDLIENGQLDAFKLLSSYLIVAESGTTLAENKLNVPVVARSKSLLSEGSLEEAIALYSCVHPAYANDFFQNSLNRQLEEKLKSVDSAGFQDFLKTLTLAENKGLVTSANEFLLTSVASHPIAAFNDVFAHVQNAGDVRRILGRKPELKKPIARQLAHQLLKSVSPTEQATLISRIATILFAPSSSEDYKAHRFYYQIIYKMANKDIKLVLPALDLMGSDLWHEKREFGTGIVNELLYSATTEHLAVEKLRLLIESNKLGQLNSVRLHNLLIKFLLADKENHVALTAKVLALDFPHESVVKTPLRFGGRNLAKFLSNEMISVELATKVVQALEDESRASLSPDEMLNAKEVLSNSPEKAELLGKLRKSATMQRWRSSTVNDLLKELANFSSSTKPAVISSLRRVILQKTLKEHSSDLDFLVSMLEQTVEWRKAETDSQVKDLMRMIEAATLSRAISANDMVLADRIWQMRSPAKLSADILLSYASRLFLNGQSERADEVCEVLRLSSQTIRPSTLEKMGRRLKGVEAGKMNELAAYLGQSFNLPQKDRRRVIVQAKTVELNTLIENNDLAGALRLAVEETAASGRAFGQLPIMIEAIKQKDRQTLESVHTLVRSTHNIDMANINLAYALIHANHTKRAADLVERQNLRIDDRVLQYFTILASTTDDVRLLKDLFTVFNDRASTLEMNKLLEVATKKMWSSNNLEMLTELSREIESTSFPLQNKLRAFFDDLKTKTASDGTEFD